MQTALSSLLQPKYGQHRVLHVNVKMDCDVQHIVTKTAMACSNMHGAIPCTLCCFLPALHTPAWYTCYLSPQLCSHLL